MTGAGGAVGGVAAGYAVPVLAAGSETAGGAGGDGKTAPLSDRERIAVLETRMEYLATKEDLVNLEARLRLEIAGIKVWVLGAVFGGNATLFGMLVLFYRLFVA